MRAAETERKPRLERISQLCAIVASLWFALVAFWEFLGPFGSGHVAASTAIGIAAENSLRWQILAPVSLYSASAPTTADYYCHHPWGIFWLTTLFVKLFGHHDWVCRLAPAMWSAATPPLLYAIGRNLWGPVAGAISTLGFVVLPIALAFANFNALEVPVIFGVLLSTWGYLQMRRTWRKRWLAVSIFGLAFAANSDWAALFFAAIILPWTLVSSLFARRFFNVHIDARRLFAWWALASGACVLVFVFYVDRFFAAGKLGEFIQQGVWRSAGSNIPLERVLETRKHWIELSFTPLAVFLGKLAVPVFLARILVLRRELEVWPLAVLVMAVAQYVVFKQGADVHIFWPHYFAAYFALALGCLSASLETVLRALFAKLRRRSLAPSYVALGVGAIPILLILPDGIAGLRYARNTGGRFDEKGNLILQDVDKVAVLKSLAPELQPDQTVVFHPGTRFHWSFAWAVERPIQVTAALPGNSAVQGRYYFADSRFLSAAEIQQLGRAAYVRRYGPFLFVDRSLPARVSDSYVLEKREPNLLERYFVQAHDPFYSLKSDAYATWEFRHHLGQTPNPPPAKPPSDLEQLRVAHNIAVSENDSVRAESLLQKLTRELDKRPLRNYANGLSLLGIRYETGVSPTLSTYFRAGEPLPATARFAIYAKLEQAPFWSLVDPEYSKEREVGLPPPLPASMWKKGYIYASVSETRKRAGVERFYGGWVGASVMPSDGKLQSDLITLQ